ncbi:G-type lectin S-receptor-like serine/threonine-protein kinase At4g03230 isoform X3 [Amaranthus tricolor]|uniref:G-type lectin S-receptor-like serine/threonine-protein kinase At4g03230 isoform X3 n=1 Tax=Amaranthus tricolor TaxID=29722 RepID=UPI00258F5D1F|nr:G-type lectin S-receptor-like serine/threonine-protein kinase At4g03230 isoform X3 [Amaranthus tricolor]
MAITTNSLQYLWHPFFAYVLLMSIPILKCSALYCLEEGSTLKQGTNIETLVSSGGLFELGFFTPDGKNSNNSYLGIWYHHQLNPKIIVWVANRNKPLLESTAFLIMQNGTAKLLDTQGATYWSTDIALSGHASLCLLDNGNLVLQVSTGTNEYHVKWQSFDSPTDTFIPGMSAYSLTGLTSWENSNNPAQGNYTLQLPRPNKNLVILEQQLKTYWESNVTPFDQTPQMVFDLLNPDPSATEGNNHITRLVMNFTGQVQFWKWKNETAWSLRWSQPKDGCSVYQICGKFGICNSDNSGLWCKCLQGFTPSSPKGWNSRDYSEGCSPNPSSSCSTEDSFLRMPMMRVNNPDANFVGSACKSACLANFACIAYSCGVADCKETSNETCLMWFEILTDLQEEYPDGLTIFIRGTRRSARVPFSFKVVVLCGAVLLSAILVYGMFLNYHMHRSMSDELQSSVRFEGDDTEGIDVPLFGWESILAATNNFSEANKLGIGGFGSVYRGKLPNGQEIAVKRLLSVTVHGVEEFKTEIKLIAKLQHRNLVRLVGYCMKANEKILIYEYMPNGSLDSCLFEDEKHSVILDWKKRFDIILGIARGLLYLHQDSRLRIIHRDLKPSNVLLDEDLNPKISDFGLAKIFGVKETEASTGRIYGTYGYMSPEYASDGIFSVKSDVFSFGVVMLETISGKRNSRIFMLEHGLSLLGHAWKLCNEDNGLELMDVKLKESCIPLEVLMCINVALLCVQDDPSDRPSISTIVQILTNGASLPFATRPASMNRKPFLETASSSSAKDSSLHELSTIPTVGR